MNDQTVSDIMRKQCFIETRPVVKQSLLVLTFNYLTKSSNFKASQIQHFNVIKSGKVFVLMFCFLKCRKSNYNSSDCSWVEDWLTNPLNFPILQQKLLFFIMSEKYIHINSNYCSEMKYRDCSKLYTTTDHSKSLLLNTRHISHSLPEQQFAKLCPHFPLFCENLAIIVANWSSVFIMSNDSITSTVFKHQYRKFVTMQYAKYSRPVSVDIVFKNFTRASWTLTADLAYWCHCYLALFRDSLNP